MVWRAYCRALTYVINVKYFFVPLHPRMHFPRRQCLHNAAASLYKSLQRSTSYLISKNAGRCLLHRLGLVVRKYWRTFFRFQPTLLGTFRVHPVSLWQFYNLLIYNWTWRLIGKSSSHSPLIWFILQSAKYYGFFVLSFKNSFLSFNLWWIFRK